MTELHGTFRIKDFGPLRPNAVVTLRTGENLYATKAVCKPDGAGKIEKVAIEQWHVKFHNPDLVILPRPKGKAVKIDVILDLMPGRIMPIVFAVAVQDGNDVVFYCNEAHQP